VNVAVLMSSYNGEEYIEQQIDSILTQKTSCDVRLFIRDDGSQDCTVDIIKHYIDQGAPITLFEGENLGYNQSFFKLLQIVDGYDFYAFSDQDDVWMEDKLEIAVSTLTNRNKPALYGSCSYLVYDELEPFGVTQQERRKITFYNTIIQNFFPGHSQVMNAALKEKITQNLDYEKIYVYDSWIVNTAIVCGELVFDNTPHTYYRMHKGNAVGFGEGATGWVHERIHRIQNGELKQYAKQIKYFVECYADELAPDERCEMELFETSKTNFFKRLRYISKTKLYRQKKKEDIMFKMLYLMGGYND